MEQNIIKLQPKKHIITIYVVVSFAICLVSPAKSLQSHIVF